MFDENIQVTSGQLLLLSDADSFASFTLHSALEAIDKQEQSLSKQLQVANSASTRVNNAEECETDASNELNSLRDASSAFASFADVFSGKRSPSNNLSGSKDDGDSTSLFDSRIKAWLPLQQPYSFTPKLDEAILEFHSTFIPFQQKLDLLQYIERDMKSVHTSLTKSAELTDLSSNAATLRREMQILKS